MSLAESAISILRDDKGRAKKILGEIDQLAPDPSCKSDSYPIHYCSKTLASHLLGGTYRSGSIGDFFGQVNDEIGLTEDALTYVRLARFTVGNRMRETLTLGQKPDLYLVFCLSDNRLLIEDILLQGLIDSPHNCTADQLVSLAEKDRRVWPSLLDVIGDDLRLNSRRWGNSLDEAKGDYLVRAASVHPQAPEEIEKIIEALRETGDKDLTVFGGPIRSVPSSSSKVRSPNIQLYTTGPLLEDEVVAIDLKSPPREGIKVDGEYRLRFTNTLFKGLQGVSSYRARFCDKSDGIQFTITLARVDRRGEGSGQNLLDGGFSDVMEGKEVRTFKLSPHKTPYSKKVPPVLGAVLLWAKPYASYLEGAPAQLQEIQESSAPPSTTI